MLQYTWNDYSQRDTALEHRKYSLDDQIDILQFF